MTFFAIPFGRRLCYHGDEVIDMTHEENERLLTLLSEYLCFTPDAIQPEDVAALYDACNNTPEEAYAALLSARLGLDPDSAADRVLYRQALPRVLRRCEVADYEADAYLRQIQQVHGQKGDVELTQDVIAPMELFVRDDFVRDGENVYPQLGWFDSAFAFPAVKEKNRVWMTVTPNEINTIQPCVKESRGRVLTFGLGLGYYAFHCLLKPEVSRVTVVERNPEVIAVFREWLLPHFPRPEALEIVQADAFDYATSHLGEYDTVFTDLWHDVEDGIPLYLRMKALEVPGPRYLYWIEKTLRCYLTE